MSAFKRVGLVSHQGNDMIAESLVRVARFLAVQHIPVVTDAFTHRLISHADIDCIVSEALGNDCDLIITVGGDGNILGAARTFAPFNVPILGVNRGRLGFLADVRPNEIETRIGEVLAGDYVIEEHFLLEGQLQSAQGASEWSLALNEVVIHPRTLPRMLEFDLYINGRFVYNQHSDGLIISSPTGSTAYSLSAGGPIMHPSLDAIVLVPMFPHTLNSRPLVVRGDSEIRIELSMDSRLESQVSFDSQGILTAMPGDKLMVQKAAARLKLIHPPGHSFFSVCRSKLDWASRLGDKRT